MAAALLLLSTNHIISGVVSRSLCHADGCCSPGVCEGLGCCFRRFLLFLFNQGGNCNLVSLILLGLVGGRKQLFTTHISVRRRPLVSAVITSGAREEVRRCRSVMRDDIVRVGRINTGL